MSRCGPAGRTAAERQPNTGTGQTPPSMGQPCLDAEAEAWIDEQHAAALAAGTPVSRRYLRQRMLQVWRRELDPEPSTPTLTYLTRHRSVPVDVAVGERVAARLSA